MGGSSFFCIEAKLFEVSVEEGGQTFMLQIYERGKKFINFFIDGDIEAKSISHSDP